MKIKRKDLQRLIESYLNEEETGSGGLSAAGKGPGGGGKVDPMPDVYQGENPFSKRSPGKAEKKRKKAPGNQMGGIAEIQRLLNQVKEQGFIDGDYQGRKLNDDGKWGDRTRSAASKFLQKLMDKGLQKKLGLTAHKSSKNLNVKKSGGEGNWRGAVQHLCENTPQVNATTEDQLEFILESFVAAMGTSGSAEGGEVKEYFISADQKDQVIRVTKKGNKIIKLEEFKGDAYVDFTDSAGDLDYFYQHYIVKANMDKVTKAEELGKFKPKAEKVLAESRGTLYRRRYSRY